VALSIPPKAISKYELWVVPWSLIGMAEVKMDNGDKQGAAELLRQAKKYKGYDFENWAAWRIKRDMDRIASPAAKD